MQVELINTGSELMLGYVLNSHQQWLCQELTALGYVVTRQTAVPDTAEDIQATVQESLGRVAVVIVTGGLGPTSDDRTRDVIAEMFGRSLKEDPAILKSIQEFFARKKRRLPESTRVQALVPEGAKVLWNDHGTAPGLALEENGKLLIMLPGPPRELRPMFRDKVVPLLRELHPPTEEFACTVLKTTGLGESFLEERVGPGLLPLVERGLELGYCARVGEVDLRLLARGKKAAALVEEARVYAVEKLAEFVYGSHPEQLNQVVIRLLREKRFSLALAESCTGGFIANRLTNVPGASEVFLAGLVTYSNEAKRLFLGVNEATLTAHGAVSEPVACEMAVGALQKTGAKFALAVTGIAGPGGGTPEKPVGTVHIAVASGVGVTARRFLNQYDRETFKYVTSQQALDWVRREILLAEPHR